MCVAERPAEAATWRSVRLRSRRTVRMRRPISPFLMRSPSSLESVLRAAGHEHDRLHVADRGVGVRARRLEVDRIAGVEHEHLVADGDAQLAREDVQELLALVAARLRAT